MSKKFAPVGILAFVPLLGIIFGPMYMKRSKNLRYDGDLPPFGYFILCVFYQIACIIMTIALIPCNCKTL